MLFRLPDGNIFALIDINFIGSQLNALLQTEPLSVHATPMFFALNDVYDDLVKQKPVDCCSISMASHITCKL